MTSFPSINQYWVRLVFPLYLNLLSDGNIISLFLSKTYKITIYPIVLAQESIPGPLKFCPGGTAQPSHGSLRLVSGVMVFCLVGLYSTYSGNLIASLAGTCSFSLQLSALLSISYFHKKINVIEWITVLRFAEYYCNLFVFICPFLSVKDSNLPIRSLSELSQSSEYYPQIWYRGLQYSLLNVSFSIASAS